MKYDSQPHIRYAFNRCLLFTGERYKYAAAVYAEIMQRAAAYENDSVNRPEKCPPECPELDHRGKLYVRPEPRNTHPIEWYNLIVDPTLNDIDMLLLTNILITLIGALVTIKALDWMMENC